MSIIKLNNKGVKNATAVGSITGLGNLVFISRSTASSSSSVSITSGIDSTYKEYIFFFNNMHPSANSYFSFNMSIDGGSNYNVTKTSNHFYSLHYENDATTQVDFDAGRTLAQGTGIQHLSAYCGTGSDEGVSGYLHLFDPSNTTFSKHFMARTSGITSNPASMDNYTSGYGNTTSAINALQFSFSSGNCDSGTIDMYGVK
jgi:hypothetical protein